MTRTETGHVKNVSDASIQLMIIRHTFHDISQLLEVKQKALVAGRRGSIDIRYSLHNEVHAAEAKLQTGCKCDGAERAWRVKNGQPQVTRLT
jgi:hypothetical protein